MSRFAGRSAARRAVVLLVLVAAVGACGGDDDGEDEAADEASFCRLAAEHLPVDEASLPILVRLEELAPDVVEEDVVVLRELAEELDGIGAGDPEGLAVEFEGRFDPDHLAAAAAVDRYVMRECAADVRRAEITRSPSTTVADGGDATDDDSTEEGPTEEDPTDEDQSGEDQTGEDQTGDEDG